VVGTIGRSAESAHGQGAREAEEEELATFRCETHGIDPVFMRGAGFGTRPNVAICLTAPERTRDGERAARRGSTRGYAAHAVRTLRPAGLTGSAMVRRAYTQRSLQSSCLCSSHHDLRRDEKAQNLSPPLFGGFLAIRNVAHLDF
jgi:hypothetical protein